MGDNTYSFDKAAVDLIIAKLSDVNITWIGKHGELYFDCRHLGYNESGVQVYVTDEGKPYRIVARESEVRFRDFPWWQRRRLVKSLSRRERHIIVPKSSA